MLAMIRTARIVQQSRNHPDLPRRAAENMHRWRVEQIDSVVCVCVGGGGGVWLGGVGPGGGCRRWRWWWWCVCWGRGPGGGVVRGGVVSGWVGGGESEGGGARDTGGCYTGAGQSTTPSPRVCVWSGGGGTTFNLTGGSYETAATLGKQGMRQGLFGEGQKGCICYHWRDRAAAWWCGITLTWTISQTTATHCGCGTRQVDAMGWRGEGRAGGGGGGVGVEKVDTQPQNGPTMNCAWPRR